MKIRSKITIYFSLATLTLAGIAFVFVYFLFSEKREEEFQMRQKDKITTTLQLLAQIRQTDNDLLDEVDLLTIHDLYDEKLLLFNSKKQLIYSSVDDVPVPFSKEILFKLDTRNNWLETKDGLYDVIGAYVESNGKAFYGISKAYDTFGYSKLLYLKYTLIVTFISISLITLCVSIFLSKKITEPLLRVANKMEEYNFEADYHPIEVSGSKNEVNVLAHQFNRLMKRMNEVFSFQKHAVQHISHELRTPISILVSNLEKMEGEKNPARLGEMIKAQKEDTRNLGEIVNSLLQIAKVESGSAVMQDEVRIDELIFDVAEELKRIYPEFHFIIAYDAELDDANMFTIRGSFTLIKSAIMNLLQNSVQYSENNQARIVLNSGPNNLSVVVENEGKTISDRERQFLFQHFFRGSNSRGKRGFGLGLVLVNRIVSLHRGTITYQRVEPSSNQFTIVLPLS